MAHTSMPSTINHQTHSVIVALLCGTMPCVFAMSCPHTYAHTDPTGSCIGPCFQRYRQVLVLLCTLGCLICYYAITVGFLQAGPVTWLYRRMVAATQAQLDRLSEVGAAIRMTFAGGR